MQVSSVSYVLGLFCSCFPPLEELEEHYLPGKIEAERMASSPPPQLDWENLAREALYYRDPSLPLPVNPVPTFSIRPRAQYMDLMTSLNPLLDGYTEASAHIIDADEP